MSARKVTKSWEQYNAFFWVSLIALTLDLPICANGIIRDPRNWPVGILSAIFVGLNILFFNKLRNSDAFDMFNKRADETVMYMNNGDLIYAYKPIVQTRRELPIVVLSMKNSDMQQIMKSDDPEMMIFKGEFSRYESYSNTVDALVGAVSKGQREKYSGSILIPNYIKPNASLTRLVETVMK